MQNPRLKKASILFLFLISSISIFANFILFEYGKKYYRQLNETRLDPLGLDFLSSHMEGLRMEPKQKPVVAFFGDSRAQEWPAPAVETVQFVNLGIGAQTSAQILQRFEFHVEPLHPDVLILQLCINDLKTIPLFPERQEAIILSCERNISRIVELSQEQGISLILTTVFPVGPVPLERKLFWSDEVSLAIAEVNSFISALAAEDVEVFDSFALLADESGQLSKEYRRDELHLNEAGYDMLNKSLADAMVAYLP